MSKSGTDYLINKGRKNRFTKCNTEVKAFTAIRQILELNFRISYFNSFGLKFQHFIGFANE